MATPIRELLSQTSYNTDGVTTVWDFSFAGGYIDKAHVKVQLLNKATGVITQVPITLANFIGPFQLSLSPAYAVGLELTIYRDTPKDLPLVDFTDKASLTEASLDLNAKQAIFVAAESSDQLSTAIESVSEIANLVDLAETYRDAAEAASIASQGQATLAAASAVVAANEAAAALASSTLAGKWAVQLVTPVAGGEYSAKYHAQAAAASAASIAGGPVASWIGLTGAIGLAAAKAALALVKGDVGLANVDNTSDVNKPLSTATLARLGTVGSAPLHNLLINAAGLVNQRGYVSGTATGVANQYTLDRWRVVVSGQSLGFVGGVFTAPAGGVEQVVEGSSNNGGVHTLKWTGTATATVNGAAVTNGGQTVSLTAGANITVRFSSGTFSLAQLEEGTVATPFERRPIGVETILCYRYCQRQNFTAGAIPVLSGTQYASTQAQCVGSLPYPLRAPGAVTASTTTFAALGGIGAYNLGAGALSMANEFVWYATFAATATATAGDACLMRTSGSQWIQFDAEL